jgi:hypothetical protein
LHYAGSLVEQIRGTPRQEIATHTFSHFYAGEGQSREEFGADLQAAVEIAARRGVTLRSIVFPRNQHNPEYDSTLLEFGIRAYRGNPRGYAWRFDTASQSRARAKRAMRLLESYTPLSGSATHSWTDVMQPSGLADVRASYPLRPYTPELRALDPLRLGRIRSSLRQAAKRGEILHLWWHPHNFGTYTEENLGFLTAVLTEVDRLRRDEGLVSITMAEAAERAAGSVAGATKEKAPL